MKKSFCFLVTALLSSCATPQASHTELLPYKDLSGPVPPRRMENKAVAAKLFAPYQHGSLDTKACCMKFLEDSLYSPQREVVSSALGAYSLIQLNVPIEAAEYLLKRRNDPYIHLQLLSTLATTQSEQREKIFKEALLEDIPVLQLYATRFLVESKENRALSWIESLEEKMPEELLPYVAELYAIEGSPSAQSHIRKMIRSGTSASISYCLTLIRDYQLIELYSELMTCTPTNTQEQEAFAYALGCQNTKEHSKKLFELANSTDPSVAMAARLSLTKFGEKIEWPKIFPSPFVLSALWKTDIPTGALEALFEEQLDSSQRLNLALSLVERHSKKGLVYIFEALQRGENQLFEPIFSSARTCSSIEMHGIAEKNTQENLYRRYTSQMIQEEIVQKIAAIFPSEFEHMAPQYLLEHTTHLTPAVIHALQISTTDSSLALLKKLSYQPGQALTRQLALFARIQKKEIPLNPQLIGSILQELRKTLATLSRPTWMDLFTKKQSEEQIQKKLTEQQRIYFTAIATLAEIKTPESSALLTKEIDETDEAIAPLVAAALLYSML